MDILCYISPISLLMLAGALLVSCLLYLKDIKTKIIPIANLSSLLVFLVSLVQTINLLAQAIDDPSHVSRAIAIILLTSLYAGVFNVAARVWVRVRELMGNRRLKIKIQAEIVDR